MLKLRTITVLLFVVIFISGGAVLSYAQYIKYYVGNNNICQTKGKFEMLEDNKSVWIKDIDIYAMNSFDSLGIFFLSLYM